MFCWCWLHVTGTSAVRTAAMGSCCSVWAADVQAMRACTCYVSLKHTCCCYVCMDAAGAAILPYAKTVAL
jgi:hypothetical protein